MKKCTSSSQHKVVEFYFLCRRRWRMENSFSAVFTGETEASAISSCWHRLNVFPGNIWFCCHSVKSNIYHFVCVPSSVQEHWLAPSVLERIYLNNNNNEANTYRQKSLRMRHAYGWMCRIWDMCREHQTFFHPRSYFPRYCLHNLTKSFGRRRRHSRSGLCALFESKKRFSVLTKQLEIAP